MNKKELKELGLNFQPTMLGHIVYYSIDEEIIEGMVTDETKDSIFIEVQKTGRKLKIPG